MRIRGVPGAERPLVQWLLVILCVAIVALAALLIRRQRTSDAAIGALRADLDTAVREQQQLERRLARERSAREAFEIGLDRERTAHVVPAISLVPGLDRSGLPKQQLRIPPDADRVQFVLPIPAKRFPRYRAAIRPFTGGDDVWLHGGLRSDATRRRLFVAVPGDVLHPGSYELAVSGIGENGAREEVATFTFEIQR